MSGDSAAGRAKAVGSARLGEVSMREWPFSLGERASSVRAKPASLRVGPPSLRANPPSLRSMRPCIERPGTPDLASGVAGSSRCVLA